MTQNNQVSDQMQSIKLSVKDKIYVFFNDTNSSVGIVVLIIGIIVLLALYPKCDIKSIRFFNTKTNHSKGIISKISNTNSIVNDHVIRKFKYQWHHQKTTYIAYSFSSDDKIQVGDTVNIKFLVEDPKLSTITGMRKAPFGITVLGGGILVILVGLFILYTSTKKLSTTLSILDDYICTKSSLKSIKKTMDEIDDEPVYKLIYTYSYHHVRYTNTQETISPKTFLKEELLVHSKNKPHKSVILKSLPFYIQTEIKKRACLTFEKPKKINLTDQNS